MTSKAEKSLICDEKLQQREKEKETERASDNLIKHYLSTIVYILFPYHRK